MAKQRARRAVKKKLKGDHESDFSGPRVDDAVVQEQNQSFKDHEVEQRIAASQAIRAAEIEHLLTGLHLLRSNFNKDQLETPVLQFFEDNMANLAVKTCEDGNFEVEWKDEDGNVSICHADERNMHASLLQRMSKAYPHWTIEMPATSAFNFSSKGGNANYFGSMNLHCPDYAVEEPSDTQTLGVEDYFQTPGATIQRLSVGMTPKSLRLPKNGEMLLSIRGSPLGTYKEDNMEAIDESEERS